MNKAAFWLAGIGLAAVSTAAAAAGQGKTAPRERDERAEAGREQPLDPGRRDSDVIVVIGRVIAGESVERAERFQAR